MGEVKQRVGAALGWLAAVGVAVVVGLIAISLLRPDLEDSSPTPLRKEEVARSLDAGGAATSPSGSRPISSPALTPISRGQTRAFTSRGGTVVGRCQAGLAYLHSWSPATGWSVDDVSRGPADSATLQFEGERADIDDLVVTVAVSCQSDAPVGSVRVTTD